MENAKTIRRDCDCFEDLPDELLISIISNLPISDLVRTSSISQRWRRLWTFSPRLDLRFDCDLSVQGFKGVFQSLLNQHRAPQLLECRNLILDRSLKKKCRGWFSELHRRSLRKLAINVVDYTSCKFPAGALSTLQELELAGGSLRLSSPLLACPGLRSLTLNKMILSETSVDSIVVGCPQLECLILVNCWSLKELQIHSEVLKRLEVRSMPDLNKVLVIAPQLVSLTMDNVGFKQDLVLHLPSLRALSTCSFEEEDDEDWRRDEGWNSIRFLELCSRLYETKRLSQFKVDPYLFSHLRKFSIRMNINNIRHSILLCFLLKESSNLEELRISNGEGSVLAYNYDYGYPYWEKQEFFDAFKLCLKYVYIKGYYGQDLELDFVKFLIVKAPILKQLVIKPKGSSTEQLKAAKILYSSLSRAESSELNIVFTGTSN